MMPVAGPFPQTAQVVALHGGVEEEEIIFLASRRGKPPIVPAPYTTNSNRVYLRGEQSVPFPMPQISGVETYGICGFYVWGILAPEGLESDFMIGNVPFPGLTSQDERFPAEYFSYDIINQRVTRIVGSATPPTLPTLLRVIRDLQNRND